MWDGKWVLFINKIWFLCEGEEKLHLIYVVVELICAGHFNLIIPYGFALERNGSLCIYSLGSPTKCFASGNSNQLTLFCATCWVFWLNMCLLNYHVWLGYVSFETLHFGWKLLGFGSSQHAACQFFSVLNFVVIFFSFPVAGDWGYGLRSNIFLGLVCLFYRHHLHSCYSPLVTAVPVFTSYRTRSLVRAARVNYLDGFQKLNIVVEVSAVDSLLFNFYLFCSSKDVKCAFPLFCTYTWSWCIHKLKFIPCFHLCESL